MASNFNSASRQFHKQVKENPKLKTNAAPMANDADVVSKEVRDLRGEVERLSNENWRQKYRRKQLELVTKQLIKRQEKELERFRAKKHEINSSADRWAGEKSGDRTVVPCFGCEKMFTRDAILKHSTQCQVKV